MKTKFFLLSSVIFILLFISAIQVEAQIVRQTDGVDWEIFKNRPTYNFSDLRNTDSIPDQIIHLDSLYTTNNSTLMDFFASRIRGYFIPPVSGEFTFYFACDNAGQFWLSPDTASANAQLKSEIFSLQNDWSQNTSSQELVAGQKYYFEVLHYDTAYIDMIKLGWMIPGDTIPTVIKRPCLSSCGDSVPVEGFNIPENGIVAYPGYTTSPGFILSPWNATDKSILWHSSNYTVASVNEEGIITTIGPGSCMIIGKAAENSALSDTLYVTVTDYYGPFFVKQNTVGKGHSWDDAIDLSLLTQRLQQGQREQQVDIYISEGIYKPTNTIDRNKTFSIQNIRLVGGFSTTSAGTDTTNRNIETHETILSGDIGIQGESLDNSYHVVTASDYVSIDGITIRDGRASCSSYGYTPGYYSFKNDDSGGGVIIPQVRSNIFISNCKFTNNSAWNSGAGICCTRASININQSSKLHVHNSVFNDNLIEQTVITTGGIFNIVVNGQGAGVTLYTSSLNATNSKFFNNSAPGYGIAIYLENAAADIAGCSIFNNIGEHEDIAAFSGTPLIMNNCTVIGSLICFFNSAFTLKNSTIIGGGYIGGGMNSVAFDNTIWTDVELSQIPDTSNVLVNHSILSYHLYGSNKYIVLSDSIPDYTLWLDTLAYNGGSTPTMKLKNIPGNYALNYGNPLYLDSTDQRGAVRTGSVSIGAYQWVDATEIVISPHQLTLTQGDSAGFSVYFLPAFSSNGLYSVSCSDNNIALVDSSMIYALTPGFVSIIAQTADGAMRDTLICQVIANAGIEVLNPNSQFSVYPNPVTNELTIYSKEIVSNIRYEILNSFGQVVFNGFFTEQTVINVSDLHPGAYLIKCTTDKTVEIMKIVKD